MTGKIVASLEEYLGFRANHFRMGDTGICILRAVISEEDTDKAEQRGKPEQRNS